MRFRMPIGRLLGVRLFVDPGLLIIFALVTVSLAMGVLPLWHPSWSGLLVWGVAFAGALLFFTSVLLHEMSHALVAKAYGLPVESITLFLFGGMANIEKEPETPASELLIAVVGPITSLAIGIGCLLGAGAIASAQGLVNGDAATLASKMGPLLTLLAWLGPVNLILGIFNLVPGFPLDGGRVLRAIVWHVTGNLDRATRVASLGGQLFGFTLIMIGVAMGLGAQIPFFGTGLIGGLWLVMIGWFVNKAALTARQRQVLTRVLGAVPIARLMRPPVATVDPGTTLDAFVEGYLLRHDQRTFPVVTGGRLVGLVGVDDVRRVRQDEWERSRVGDVMKPVADLQTLPPDADGSVALDALGRPDVDELPIVEEGRLVGMVRRRDLVRWLEVYGEPA